jgi:hypothetical protein
MRLNTLKMQIYFWRESKAVIKVKREPEYEIECSDRHSIGLYSDILQQYDAPIVREA